MAIAGSNELDELVELGGWGVENEKDLPQPLAHLLSPSRDDFALLKQQVLVEVEAGMGEVRRFPVRAFPLCN